METITQQLHKMAEQICDDYCKYRELVLEECEDPDEANEYLIHNHCNDCPLSKVV